MSKCTCTFPCGGTVPSCPSAPDMEGYHNSMLRIIDNEIHRLEKELARCNEVRREYINRNNLNKV